LGVISFVQSLQEPDNSTILDAINQLQQTLNTDFAQLGDLIQQQTQIIVDTVNRDGMALALSNSDVATARILFDLSGRWASGGVAGPVISVNNPFISVDMSTFNRPTATGRIVDSSDITVTFPDADTFTGKLQIPNTILWSNHSAWTKVEVAKPSAA
jgi:hypothetical protein